MTSAPSRRENSVPPAEVDPFRPLILAILLGTSSAAGAADYNYRIPLAPHEVEVYPPLPYGLLIVPEPPLYSRRQVIVVTPPPGPPPAMLPRLMPPPVRMRPPGPVPPPEEDAGPLSPCGEPT